MFTVMTNRTGVPNEIVADCAELKVGVEYWDLSYIPPQHHTFKILGNYIKLYQIIYIFILK